MDSIEKNALAVIDAARLGVWLWNMETGELRLNERWAEMLGFTLVELEPITIETCARLRHPHDQAAAMIKAERHLAGLEPYFEAEVRMLHKAGHWVWILDRGQVTSRSEDGRPLIMVGAHQDITAQKLSKGELSVTSERLRLCMNLAGIGIWEKDLSTGNFSFDRRAREIFGLEQELKWIPHDDALRLVHPDDRPALIDDGRSAITTGLAVESRFRVRGHDGGERHVYGHAIALRTFTEKAILLGVTRDLTDEVVRAEELEAKRVDAEAAVLAKSRFLANMSHEIRTPLTSIIAFTGLAESQPELSEISRDFIQRVDYASRQLLATVNDILDFSKIDAGEMVLSSRPVSLTKLSREVLELFLPQAGTKKIDLILDIDAESAELILTLDPHRTRQILINLISNAVKFTQSGSITLRANYDFKAYLLRVSVIDTGKEIPAELQDIIFERFTQADSSLSRTNSGSGLGLAICKGLIEVMGGRIGITSRVDKGNIFWLEIPTHIASVSPAQAAYENSVDAILSGVRALLVGGTATDRRLMALYIVGAGAEVLEAVDGVEAITMADENAFDVILMDIQNPPYDGNIILQNIRNRSRLNKATPILAFTTVPDLKELAQPGFDATVLKPFVPADLLAAVSWATDFVRQLRELPGRSL
jgi:PAS domain S-box-containing protein